MTDVRILVGDRIVDRIKPADRGLAYGDGVFETFRVHAGRAIWWDAHWERLALGAACLGIPLPDEVGVRMHVDALIAGQRDGVLKLVLTRGVGGRGYAPPIDLQPTLVISLHGAPPPPTPPGGIALRWCEMRLAIQRALAGIKHCNRLEQVLARAEWGDSPVAGAPGTVQQFHEGLMRDTEGFAVCATATNLFVLREGRWVTPPVDQCGVAGVCRGWILEHANAGERRLTVDDVESADAIFLCNSVRGILQVATLGDRRWSPHPRTVQLRQMLASVEPCFGDNIEGT
jgi:4-amino-4-deoxychorismate lyase